MSNNKQNESALSMKVLKGPKQIKREKKETIWDRFERLQRSLAPLRRDKQIKRGVYRIRRIEEINIFDSK
jgi:ribosomal protein L19E